MNAFREHEHRRRHNPGFGSLRTPPYRPAPKHDHRHDRRHEYGHHRHGLAEYLRSSHRMHCDRLRVWDSCWRRNHYHYTPDLLSASALFDSIRRNYEIFNRRLDWRMAHPHYHPAPHSDLTIGTNKVNVGLHSSRRGAGLDVNIGGFHIGLGSHR